MSCRGGSVTVSRLHAVLQLLSLCEISGGVGVTVHCERVVACDRAGVLVLCRHLHICIRGMRGQGAFGTLCSRWWHGVPSLRWYCIVVARRCCLGAVHLYAALQALSLCEWSVAEGADDAPGSLCVGGGAGLHWYQHVHTSVTCSSFNLALAHSFVLISIVLLQPGIDA